MSVCARNASATSLLDEIRSEIQAVDPGLPYSNVRSMTDVMDVSIAPRRFSRNLVGVFAASRCFILHWHLRIAGFKWLAEVS